LLGSVSQKLVLRGGQVDVELADLVSRMLVEDADRRLTAMQALGHPFFTPASPLHWMLRPQGRPPCPAALK
jgi:serine/threonine protein kinase